MQENLSRRMSSGTKPRCYFIATSWGDRAVPRHFLALSKELVARGHQVVILVDGQERVADNYESKLAVYTWPSKRPVKLRDARFLYGLIRQYRPDCLISNFGAENVMLLVGSLAGVPCRIAWYHTLSTQIDIDAELPRWKIKLLRLRKRIVYKSANYIVPVSNAAREDVRRLYHVEGDKCPVFYNSLADPVGDSNLHQATEERNRLVCVGRLDISKGQDVLIRAVALLKKVLPDVYVEFVGKGASAEFYSQLARDLEVEDSCAFVGQVPYGEILTRMRTSAATVVPSRSDNCPLVVIESLAVGTPVIASGVGGIVELIRDEVDGFLVPSEAPDVLAEKIRILLADAGLRQKIRGNARQRFLTHFEQSKSVKLQAEWLESVVARPVADALKV